MTFETLKEHIENLSSAELNKLQAWKNAGQVKRRWFAFVAGVIVGAAAVLVFGCSGQQPRASMNADGSACFPGPKVVE